VLQACNEKGIELPVYETKRRRTGGRPAGRERPRQPSDERGPPVRMYQKIGQKQSLLDAKLICQTVLPKLDGYQVDLSNC
jgi:hypothetical protein